MRAHASKVGGSSAVQLAEAAGPAVGKQTLVEQARVGAQPADELAQWEDIDPAELDGADGGDRELASAAGAPTATAARKRKKHKTLAQIGEQILNGINKVLEGFADELSKYSEHGAHEAKEQLQHIQATCGPGSTHIQHRVQVQADKLTSFYFARLMREAAVQARNMAKACHELHKNLHDHKPGALLSFIGDALDAARELVGEFGEFSRDVQDVDDIVHDISVRCGHRVELAIPHAMRPLVIPKPKYEFHINPKLLPGGPIIVVPGLKIPGNHRVLPRRFEVRRGPVLGDYAA
jgi:hypothetical protein